MNEHLKQRIVGMIVGVIFIIVATWFLFSGSPNKNAKQQLAPASASGPVSSFNSAAPAVSPTTSSSSPEIALDVPASSVDINNGNNRGMTASDGKMQHADLPLPQNHENVNSAAANSIASGNSASLGIEKTQETASSPLPSSSLSSSPSSIANSAPVTPPAAASSATSAIPISKATAPAKNVAATAVTTTTNSATTHSSSNLVPTAGNGHKHLAVQQSAASSASSATATKHKTTIAQTHKSKAISEVKKHVTPPLPKKPAKKKNTMAVSPAAASALSSAASAASAPTAGNKLWIVNAGLYHERLRAEALVSKLKVDGYRAAIQKGKVKDKVFYRVVVGPNANKEKATMLAQRIARVFKIKTTLVPAVTMPLVPASQGGKRTKAEAAVANARL
jgi:cell division septation protein DedD